MISSSANQQIRHIIQLQKKAKLRNETGTFVSEGLRMYQEIPQESIIKTYVSEEFEKNNTIMVKDMLNLEIVADKVFEEMSETMTPQGILAIVKKPQYDFTKILEKENVLLLFLEDIRDPGNMGTILRTAEGAGVDGIVISRESVDMFNPKVIRSTMGAIYRMPFLVEEDMIGAIKDKYKPLGIHMFGAALECSKDYSEVDFKGKTGIIIGNEANGISPNLLTETDTNIIIPMCGKLESLNAAVAAAILIYEANRQRR